ncbi:hypothetical protein JCM8547_003336, partial [Rhodosporidiobolus lusitaniae]
MSRTRPAPLSLAPPSAHGTYLAFPSPSNTPVSAPPLGRVSSFVLKVKRSTLQLRLSANGPPPSPYPSPLISPSLFPLPPPRNDDGKDAPFTDLGRPLPPALAVKGLTPPLLSPAMSTSSGSSRSGARTPLTPDTPYTPAKLAFPPPSGERNLVFPHRRRIRPTTIYGTVERRGKAELDEEELEVMLYPPSPRLKTTPLAFPSFPPHSPRRLSRLPATPPATPPRLSRSPPPSPPAPKATRICSSFPEIAKVDPPVFTFSREPAAHRTPPPAAKRSSTYSTFSDPCSTVFASPTSSINSNSSSVSHYPTTPPSPHVFSLAPCPPPRPPRSPFRPTSKLLKYDEPLPPLPFEVRKEKEKKHDANDEDAGADSEAESTVDSPAFSLPPTPSGTRSTRRALPDSPSPLPRIVVRRTQSKDVRSFLGESMADVANRSLHPTPALEPHPYATVVAADRQEKTLKKVASTMSLQRTRLETPVY